MANNLTLLPCHCVLYWCMYNVCTYVSMLQVGDNVHYTIIISYKLKGKVNFTTLRIAASWRAVETFTIQNVHECTTFTKTHLVLASPPLQTTPSQQELQVQVPLKAWQGFPRPHLSSHLVTHLGGLYRPTPHPSTTHRRQRIGGDHTHHTKSIVGEGGNVLNIRT